MGGPTLATQFHFDLRAIARAQGGQVVGGQVSAPGPGHSARDRSLSVRISPSSPDGFVAFSHAGDAWQACRDHIRARLGSTGEPYRPRALFPKPAIKADDVDRLWRAAAIYDEAGPIAGTDGEAYLARRGIVLDDVP